jgi:hypothetical protein
MNIKEIEIYSKKKALDFFNRNLENFYKNLPFYVENYSSFKIIFYVYSKDLTAEIEKAFLNFKEYIQNYSCPYEEKYLNFDYLFDVSPLYGREKDFLLKVLYYDNLIDKRILEKWIVFAGRNLKRKLVDVFINISKETTKEPFAIILFFILTLVNKFKTIKKDFMNINLGKISNDRKDVYFSHLFYFYLMLIIDEVFDEFKTRIMEDYIFYNQISPIVFADIKTSFFRSFNNVWLLSERLFSMLEKLKIYDNTINDDLVNTLSENKDVNNEILNIRVFKELRDIIFNYLSKNYVDVDFFKTLIQLLYLPANLVKFTNNITYRNSIFKLSRELNNKKEIYEGIVKLKNNIDFKIQQLMSSDKRDLLLSILKGYFQFKYHELFNNDYLNSALLAIKDRATEQAVDVEDEYNKGKLYYFSLEKGKLIKKGAEEKVSAIYIDIRDFSRKTIKLKESSIGELLKDKFYQPILHYASDKSISQEIHFHNIVGDSLIFSGSIEEIIKLAIIIKKDSEDYKRGLEHVIYDEDKKELMSVDVGIFITYGDAPLIFSITSEFGTHNIALGEIINLASRGSKRDFNAKRRLDYMISFESKIRGVNVELPFNVYVVEGYNFIVPPTLEAKLLSVKDKNEEKNIINSYIKQLKIEFLLGENSTFLFKQKFIYNIGIGLTEEAFIAFLQVMRVFSDIKKIIINVQQLPKEIQKKYLFKDEIIEFCYVKNRKTKDVFLFRKEGSIIFKGYENETVIWELITKEMPIYRHFVELVEGQK